MNLTSSMEPNAEGRFDLAVVYRVYPLVSKSPFIFADDKFRLTEICLRSFAGALGDLKVKIWVLLDGCPDSYHELFAAILARWDYELISLPSVGGEATFRQQIEILTTQNDADLVFLAEDDYLYRPKSIAQAVDALKECSDQAFMTLYDSNDYYALALHRYDRSVEVLGGRHWQTVSCTTLSFLASKAALCETKRDFLTYTRGNFDSSLWMTITKLGHSDLGAIKRYLVGQDRDLIRIVKAWWFGWRRILTGKRYRLLSPVPSLGTHLESGNKAPTIDWIKEAEDMESAPLRQ